MQSLLLLCAALAAFAATLYLRQCYLVRICERLRREIDITLTHAESLRDKLESVKKDAGPRWSGLAVRNGNDPCANIHHICAALKNMRHWGDDWFPRPFVIRSNYEECVRQLDSLQMRYDEVRHTLDRLTSRPSNEARV